MAVRTAMLVAVTLLAGACGVCRHTDIDFPARQWQATLDAKVPPGTAAPEVVAFLASYRLPATYRQDEHRLAVLTPIPSNDDRAQCNVVTWQLQLACDFDASDRVRACTATPIGTGP